MNFFPPSFSATFELAYELKGDHCLLKLIIPENSKGIIYRVTAVLFAHGWDILEANFEIIPNGKIHDLFFIRNLHGIQMDDQTLHLIKNDLRELFEGGVPVSDYLENFELPPMQPPTSQPIIQVFNPEKSDSTVLDIKTQDRPGLLFEISQLLFLLDIDILSVTAQSDGGWIRDTFLLRKDSSRRLDLETMERIKNGLVAFL